MQALLDRIENWLQHHAPSIHQSLNPPAGDDAFAELEKLAGTALPEAFKTLYRWHDGQNGVHNLFSSLVFLELNRITALYRSNLEQESFRKDIAEFLQDNEELDERIHPQGFALKPSWLPFMSDFGRCSLYIDLQKGDLGQFGRVLFMDMEYDMAFVVSDSLEDFVKMFDDDLQAGLYHLSQELLNEKNIEWLESDAKIDIINWQWSERYQRK